MTEIFTPEEVSRMAAMLLQMGMHPSVVRRRLAEKGVHWFYQFRSEAGGAPQGLRQRLRNLRRQGLGLCSMCRAGSYPLTSTVNVCQACLDKKWSGKAPEDFRAT